MTVPLSDAVASSVPSALIERKEMGDLCAWMTFATVSERVEKIRTSPACWWDEEEDGWEGVGWDKGVVGEGTGDGYARNDLSAEGESATTAAWRQVH